MNRDLVFDYNNKTGKTFTTREEFNKCLVKCKKEYGYITAEVGIAIIDCITENTSTRY